MTITLTPKEIVYLFSILSTETPESIDFFKTMKKIGEKLGVSREPIDLHGEERSFDLEEDEKELIVRYWDMIAVNSQGISKTPLKGIVNSFFEHAEILVSLDDKISKLKEWR